MPACVYGNVSEAKVEAAKEINDILGQIHDLYEKAADIAREADVPFTYKGPAGYGDGGYFDADRTEDHYGNECDGWLASSQSC